MNSVVNPCAAIRLDSIYANHGMPCRILLTSSSLILFRLGVPVAWVKLLHVPCTLGAVSKTVGIPFA